MALKSITRASLAAHWRHVRQDKLNRYLMLTSRCFTQDRPAERLWKEYENARENMNKVQSLPHNVDTYSVFANNELDMSEIEVFGFDYDYTLANYTDNLHYLLYDLGRDYLVSKFKYPEEIVDLPFDPKFSARGLHFDVQEGNLLKIDAFHTIQMGTVFKGLHPVSDKDVLETYNGIHVPLDIMSGFHGKGPRMYQLMDLFALPEITLLANVTEFFERNSIPYHPENLFRDVTTAIQSIHKNGELHQAIMNDLETYLCKEDGQMIGKLLKKLSDAGKKLFLITNSGYPFVNKGMSFMVGEDWKDLFDVIVVSAMKPQFFTESSRPFRMYSEEIDSLSYDRVRTLKKDSVYREGNINEFQRLTSWYGNKVLYFGDHVYSDLAMPPPVGQLSQELAKSLPVNNLYSIRDINWDATLRHGWRTGAIIPELEDEIQVLNSDQYKSSVMWLVMLQDLIEKSQVYNDEESREVISQWLAERNELRQITKKVFNKQFGSVFRTYHNPSYFTRRLCRFADIYTSSIVNLLNYQLTHTFYPRRAALPHEMNYSVVLPTS